MGRIMMLKTGRHTSIRDSDLGNYLLQINLERKSHIAWQEGKEQKFNIPISLSLLFSNTYFQVPFPEFIYISYTEMQQHMSKKSPNLVFVLR